jgi:GNAT superfamily N-acetyltransferase
MDDVAALKALCDERDRLDNILHLDAGDAPPLRHHAGGALVGVLTVQAGDPPEVCLLVHPAHRRRGIGRRLLVHLARIAVERGCGRMEWSVLDWNTPARDFYFKLGAVAMDEWTVFRMTPEAFERLAREGDGAAAPEAI